jgi:hypothetical protein
MRSCHLQATCLHSFPPPYPGILPLALSRMQTSSPSGKFLRAAWSRQLRTRDFTFFVKTPVPSPPLPCTLLFAALVNARRVDGLEIN